MLKRTLTFAFSFWLANFFVGSATAVPAIDLDGDGLSDIWQIAFDAADLLPEEDSDGDGFSNLVECEHGTDPLDASSHFEIYGFEADPKGIAVRFEGALNQSYGLEVSDDLVNWRPSSDWLISDGGEEKLVETNESEKVRFLRFVVGGDRDDDGISDYEESLIGFDPLTQHSDSSFEGGDMARLSTKFFSDGAFEVGGKPVQGSAPTLEEASRFLTQAALGSKLEDIEVVAAMGYEAWIDDQFQQEIGRILPRVQWWYENDDNVFYVHRRYAWWEQVMTSPDLLRQRLAVALSEVYVLSDAALDGGAATSGMAQFYDLLLENSFGNWRNLLSDVSLHPAMGEYLSHLQNRKANAELNRYPDENYAREIMQLFSIGLFELNADGTRKQDQEGNDIPTYDNDDITNFARVFTGFSWGGPNNDISVPWHFHFGDWDWEHPMKVWDEEHDTDSKELLRGTILPSFEDDPDRTPMDDFEDAMDNLFEHPNVGPFICYRLIQRLITSNPTPEYVKRVSRVFDDNGKGVRGDMRSVVKAILLDFEARSLRSYDDPNAGRLREPYLRWVRLVKSLGANSDDESYLIPDWGHLDEMGQRLMSSNSVFNFFSPDYVPPGEMDDAGLVGPEFQILTATTAMATQNIYGGALMWGFGIWDSERPGDQNAFEFIEEIAMIESGGLEDVIARFDLILCHGTLREETKDLLRDAYSGRPGWFSDAQTVGMLVRIIILSPEFAVTR